MKAAWFARRLLSSLPVLLVVTTAVFFLTHLIPGDPIDFQIGENAQLDQKRELRWQFGLDLPIMWSGRVGLQREDVAHALRSAGPAVGREPPPSSTSEQRSAARAMEDLGAYAVPSLVALLDDPEVAVGACRALPLMAIRPHAALPFLTDPVAAERAAFDIGLEELGGQLDELAEACAEGDLAPARAFYPDWLERHRGLFERTGAQRLLARPLDTQYARFLPSLLDGSLRSHHSRRPVWEVLGEKLPYTLSLAITALCVAGLIAIPLGIVAALRRGTWVDHLSTMAALTGISLPNFWIGPLLIMLFAVELGWLPVSGASQPGALVLPALTLGIGMSAILTRMTRASMLEVLDLDYIRTARAKGVAEWRVIGRHGLRNALLPVVTIMGLQFGALLAGSIITEEVFGWPGLGREVIAAIRSRDFPMVQGCVLVIACSYVVVNLVTDLLYQVVDPRVQLR